MKNAKNLQAPNFREFYTFANVQENKVLAKIWCSLQFYLPKSTPEASGMKDSYLKASDVETV